MISPDDQCDEDLTGELTPREALREIAVIIRDAAVAMLLFIFGVAVHGWLGWPTWMYGVSFLPFTGWIWWRLSGKREMSVPLSLLIVLITLASYTFHFFWPNRQDWPIWLHGVMAVILLCVFNVLFWTVSAIVIWCNRWARRRQE